MLYRATDRLRRGGAPVKNLTHSNSFHSDVKNAPSKPGIKHIVAGHPIVRPTINIPILDYYCEAWLCAAPRRSGCG
jgi:hypothetical protein